MLSVILGVLLTVLPSFLLHPSQAASIGRSIGDRRQFRYSAALDGVPQQSGAASNPDFNFQAVDVTLIVDSPDGGEYRLEAFKSTGNDAILAERSGRVVPKSSRLTWSSVGQPVFVQTSDASRSSRWAERNNSTARLFHFTPTGFYVRIQALTAVHRKLLAAAASKKFDVHVTSNQIASVVLNDFECTTVLQDDETGLQYPIRGVVSDFKTFPFRMDFGAAPGSPERRLFVEKLNAESANVDESSEFQFDCSMAANGRLVQATAALTLNPGDSGVMEKLIGSPTPRSGIDSICVTQTQLTNLADELYTKHDVGDTYVMSRTDFAENFVDAVIGQAAANRFTFVPVDSALAAMSKYGFDFSSDVKAADMKRGLGELLKVEGREEDGNASCRRIVEFSAVPGDRSILIDTDVFGVRSAVDWARENAARSCAEVGSVDDQLRRLNGIRRGQIKWTRDGDKIVPQNINVARLSIPKLQSRAITLRDTSLQSYNAPFYREFSMYVSGQSAPPPASVLANLMERLVDLEAEVNATATASAVAGNNNRQLATDLRGMQLQLAGLAAMKSQGSIKHCRLCWRLVENSQGCLIGQQQRTSSSFPTSPICSGWTDDEPAPQWTETLQVLYDGSYRMCRMQWMIECENNE